MSSSDCCLLLRGKVFSSTATDAQSWGYNYGLCWGQSCADNTPGRFIGNVSQLNINIDYELKQNLNLNGSIYEADCSACLINGVEFSMVMKCFSDENLTESLMGSYSQTTVDTTPVTDHFALPSDDVPFVCGTLIPFNKPGVDPASVTVVRTDTNAPLVEGVDYEVDGCGIEMKSTFLFPPGVGLMLSYTYKDGFRSIEPLTQECKDVRLTFKGKNATNGEEMLVQFHRVKLSPASTLQLINDTEFPELELTGVLLPDKTISGNNTSQYFSIKRIGL